MDTERTLVLVKPDGVQRGLIGQVLGRLERRGLKLIGLKLLQMDADMANQHYAEHVEKPFFPGLRDFITSGPLVAAAFEGDHAVQLTRNAMGATNPVDAQPGSIRADFGGRSGPQRDSRLRFARIGRTRSRALLRSRRTDQLEPRHRTVDPRIG